jgi:molecular chaperone DnaJ
MPQNKRCYYEVIGCNRDASADELRKAYKQKALKYHPDRNPGDGTAEAKFKELNEAYQVLSDEEKRRIYDQYGHAGVNGGAGGFDGGFTGEVFSTMQDLFSDMFGAARGGRQQQQRPQRGADLRVQIRLTFRQAAFGCKREVTVRGPMPCADCGATGAKPGTKPEACEQCRGVGQVTQARGFVMFTSACPHCRGRGQVVRAVCGACQGQGLVERPRKVMVTFPAGVDAGQRLRVVGHGVPGSGAGATSGDLFVEIEIEEDARFERDGADVVTRAHVSMTEAALGGEIGVPGLEEKTLRVTIPSGSQWGDIVVMRGEGVPKIDGSGRGALKVVLKIDVPTVLSKRARELLRALDEELRTDHDYMLSLAAMNDGERAAK